MLRRRFLAMLAVAGLPTKLMAQTDNRPWCTPDSKYSADSIYVKSSFNTAVAAGGSPVTGTVYDSETAMSGFTTSSGQRVEHKESWEVICELPEDRVALKLVIENSAGMTIRSIGLSRGTRDLMVVSGEKLYLRFGPYHIRRDGDPPSYVIDFGDGKRTDPGAIEAVAMLLEAEPLGVTLTFNTGQRLLTQIHVPRFGERRLVAKRLVREQTDRYKRGECKLQEGGGCYLTTATVGVVGLADDCWELTTLRRFRDTVLADSPEGRELVESYYATAPDLVRRISMRDDWRAQWLRTYFTGILPSAIAAQLGLNRIALRLYSAMTMRLQVLAQR